MRLIYKEKENLHTKKKKNVFLVAHYWQIEVNEPKKNSITKRIIFSTVGHRIKSNVE